ncbi:MAG: alpha-amylase family glycosyl hydrolase, partial [Cyanobacteria bacterium P01_A01_bin.17]
MMASEFLFGSLSTPSGRLKRTRAVRVGFVHELDLDPIDPKPGKAIALSVTVGHDISVIAVDVFYTVNETAPTPETLEHCHCVPMKRSIQWDTLHWSELERWSAMLPAMAEGDLIQYLIRGVTPTGKTIFCPYVQEGQLEQSDLLDTVYLERLHRIDSPQVYSFVVDTEAIPDWFKQAVIYQIFVDRFSPDSGASFSAPRSEGNVCGGTLQGILNRLDYLSQLGITCLWLTPIFPSPTYHGYDVTDFGSVESRLGTMADLRQLLSAATERNMRVILDYVANHCSRQHPAFVAATQSQQSETYSWFRFAQWPDRYDSFYDLPDLPKFNTDHPAVQAYLIEHACYWLELGVSGFRLDHAHGASHAFWSRFRAKTRAIAPDSVTFGEITETSQLMRSFAGRMDGCLDFRLAELLRGFFAYGTVKVSEFDRALSRHFAYFQDVLALPSFLDNHDMSRFLWIVRGDHTRLRLAAFCQFTLPGTPIVYYGTEVGLSQKAAVGRLEETRLPMPWDDFPNPDLLAFYRQLIHFRQAHSEVWGRSRRAVVIDDGKGVYAYAVGPFLIVLNNNNESATVTLSDEQVIEPALITTTMTPFAIENKQGNRQENRQTIYLPSYGGAVYS